MVNIFIYILLRIIKNKVILIFMKLKLVALVVSILFLSAVFAIPAKLVGVFKLNDHVGYVSRYFYSLPHRGFNIKIEVPSNVTNISVYVSGNFTYHMYNHTICIRHRHRNLTIKVEKFIEIIRYRIPELKHKLLNLTYINERRIIGNVTIVPYNSTVLLIKLPAWAICRVLWILPVNITIDGEMLVDVNDTVLATKIVRPWWAFLCTKYE